MREPGGLPTATDSSPRWEEIISYDDRLRLRRKSSADHTVGTRHSADAEHYSFLAKFKAVIDA
jgi:hypothetical protein